MNPYEAIRIRPPERIDRVLARREWLSSYSTSPFAHWLTPSPAWGIRVAPLYYDWQERIIDRLLERAEMRVAVVSVVPSGAIASVVGWAVLEDGADPVVHYVHVVRQAYRKGVAKALVGELATRPVRFTHRNELALRFAPKTWRFDPRPALEVLP